MLQKKLAEFVKKKIKIDENLQVLDEQEKKYIEQNIESKLQFLIETNLITCLLNSIVLVVFSFIALITRDERILLLVLFMLVINIIVVIYAIKSTFYLIKLKEKIKGGIYEQRTFRESEK